MNSWSGLDFFILLIFFVNTVLGMSRGASREIISIMCVAVALICTIKFTVPLTEFILGSPAIKDIIDSRITQSFMSMIGADPLTGATIQHIAYCISILVCFVGVFATGEAVLNFTGIVQAYSFPYAFMDRKLGAALGCTKGYVFTLLFIVILHHLFVHYSFGNSYFINLFQGAANGLDNLITAQTPEQYQSVFSGAPTSIPMGNSPTSLPGT